MSGWTCEREDCQGRLAPPSDDAIGELREAFEKWESEHGVIWFETDQRLAEAVAGVLGIEIEWEAP